MNESEFQLGLHLLKLIFGCVLRDQFAEALPPPTSILYHPIFFVLAQNDTKCVKTRLEAKKVKILKKKFPLCDQKKNLVKFSKKNEKFFFGFFFDFIL